MPPAFKSLTFENILSFGPEPQTLELGPLNVLIGANACGKSNVLDALALLTSCATDLEEGVRNAGGMRELVCGGIGTDTTADLSIGCVVHTPYGVVAHGTRLLADRGMWCVDAESAALGAEAPTEATLLLERAPTGEGRLVMRSRGSNDALAGDAGVLLGMTPADVPRSKSVLSEKRDSARFPALSDLSEVYRSTAIYGEWALGRHAPARQRQPSDGRLARLEPDASNLALILNHIVKEGGRAELESHMRRFYPAFERLEFDVAGGTIQLGIQEKGLDRPIPATRLSDGTIRFLALLAVLLHPEPSPVVCFEEPEIGLHPDSIVQLGELLESASERMQIILTTQSDILVDAVSDDPSRVVVFSHGEGGTRFERLDPERLREWLERYSLGELWLRGHIGGGRW